MTGSIPLWNIGSRGSCSCMWSRTDTTATQGCNWRMSSTWTLVPPCCSITSLSSHRNCLGHCTSRTYWWMKASYRTLYLSFLWIRSCLTVRPRLWVWVYSSTYWFYCSWPYTFSVSSAAETMAHQLLTSSSNPEWRMPMLQIIWLDDRECVTEISCLKQLPFQRA